MSSAIFWLQVIYHHLRPKDKFLVLASDGLWDMFPNNNSKVVQLIADHMIGAQTNSDFYLPKDRTLELGKLNKLLRIRKVRSVTLSLLSLLRTVTSHGNSALYLYTTNSCIMYNH